MESAALWRLLRPQLNPQLDPPPDNVRAIASGRPRPAWRSNWPTRLAALFFVALVGLTAWNLSLQSRVDRFRAPRPNEPIVDIPAGERDPTQGELTLSTGPKMLMLHPGEQLPAYRLVIRDAATGKEVVSSNELKLDRDFALTLYLPEGLRPGRCRMELSDGSGRVLETHSVRVAEPGPGG